MTKKPQRAKKSTKSSKRTKGPAHPDEETETITKSVLADAPQATSAAGPQSEVAELSQQPVAQAAQAAPATPATTSNPVTRSDAAKANIKEGLRLHQIAGRPTRQQLTLVFGQKGYLLTWPKRTERFGITPETFQAALAKGVPAIRLGPGAQTVVEEAKETA